MLRLICLIVAGTVFAAGCAAPAPPTPTLAPAKPAPTELPAKSAFPVEITDDAGRSLSIQRAPQRIVSLVPSNTEILYALGLGDRVVGVDDFSDYPPEAKQKPKIGGMKANLEQILNLQPDLVLATSANPPDLIKQLEANDITVLFLDAQTIEGIFADIELVGRAVGKAEDAKELTSKLRLRMKDVTAKLKDAPKVRVFLEIDATDPNKPFTAGPGTFIHELITLAKGENVAEATGQQWPQMSAESLIAADPEIILLADAEFGVKPEDVGKRPGWDQLTAVKNNAIFPISSNIVSRPGPRIVEGLEAMAKILHPEVFR